MDIILPRQVEFVNFDLETEISSLAKEGRIVNAFSRKILRLAARDHGVPRGRVRLGYLHARDIPREKRTWKGMLEESKKRKLKPIVPFVVLLLKRRIRIDIGTSVIVMHEPIEGAFSKIMLVRIRREPRATEISCAYVEDFSGNPVVFSESAIFAFQR